MVEERDKIAFKVKNSLHQRQNIRFVANSLYYEVKQYVSNRAFFKPISKNFTPAFRTDNTVSFTEACHEMNLKALLYLVLINLKYEVNFFIREFLEVFYFPNVFTVIMGSF